MKLDLPFCAFFTSAGGEDELGTERHDTFGEAAFHLVLLFVIMRIAGFSCLIDSLRINDTFPILLCGKKAGSRGSELIKSICFEVSTAWLVGVL